ncbi:MAG: hypothetical protein ACD_3C00154G0008 [uncultured bacterium (gcode 4)]|uniref:Uncharacterized protein n=1 Tax=uncultured bacterium (gcode 4) TaxID=1234023 RepID=K2GWP0_9BACT|nr:MAG: hypothetical protein ACD_3C00154G0008 [uncultured bacterium (gcode 4)]
MQKITRVARVLIKEFKKLPWLLRVAFIVFFISSPCYFLGIILRNGDLFTYGISGVWLAIIYFGFHICSLICSYVLGFLRKQKKVPE